LWLTPGLYKERAIRGGSTPVLDEIEAFNRQAVGEDFARYKPDLVIVDMAETQLYFGGLPYDYIKDLSENPQFEAQWKHYQRVETVASFAVYRRRKS
jgi:hypothetical protein